MAVTRLAQRAEQVIDGEVVGLLKPRMYYDCNPPSKAHWTYRLFIEKRDPDTREPIGHPEDYQPFRINPVDNTENLSAEYLKTLESLSERQKRRFDRNPGGEHRCARPQQPGGNRFLAPSEPPLREAGAMEGDDRRHRR